MKILITGASGFVGQNLSQYLENKGEEIISLSLRNSDWKLDKSVDAIVHLTGKAHDISNTSSAEEYFTINRDLTKKVFQEFLDSDIQDFFYFSSVKAVADTVEGVLKEDVKPTPFTPYGKSKIEAEDFLLAQKLPNNKRLFIIRPCMIHGPNNKGNLNLLYQVVNKNVPYPLAAFENKRSFLSIDNLSFLIHSMLKDKSLASGIYNFSDDNAISTNELVQIISKNIHKKEKLWRISPRLIKFVAKTGDVLKLPLNSERLKKLTESYVVSNQKIKDALGIQKLPLSAEEGLSITIKSFNK